MDLIETWYVDRCYCTLQFNTSLTDIDLDQKSQGWQKAKTFAKNISQNFQMI